MVWYGRVRPYHAIQYTSCSRLVAYLYVRCRASPIQTGSLAEAKLSEAQLQVVASALSYGRSTATIAGMGYSHILAATYTDLAALLLGLCM